MSSHDTLFILKALSFKCIIFKITSLNMLYNICMQSIHKHIIYITTHYTEYWYVILYDFIHIIQNTQHEHTIETIHCVRNAYESREINESDKRNETTPTTTTGNR